MVLKACANLTGKRNENNIFSIPTCDSILNTKLKKMQVCQLMSNSNRTERSIEITGQEHFENTS